MKQFFTAKMAVSAWLVLALAAVYFIVPAFPELERGESKSYEAITPSCESSALEKIADPGFNGVILFPIIKHNPGL